MNRWDLALTWIMESLQIKTHPDPLELNTKIIRAGFSSEKIEELFLFLTISEEESSLKAKFQ